MNHLVVFAHPRKESFTRRVCDTWIAAAGDLGHRIVLRDLYALRFNPVADADEAYTKPPLPPPADVQAEMDHLVAADVVTFISPVWWIAPPAIMKGWLDQVLRGGGFAYGYGPSGPTGTLKGKRGVVFTSSGSTEKEFLDSRKMESIRTMWRVGTLEFCGIHMLDHVHFGPVGSRATTNQIEGYLNIVRETARRHFAPQ